MGAGSIAGVGGVGGAARATARGAGAAGCYAMAMPERGPAGGSGGGGAASSLVARGPAPERRRPAPAGTPAFWRALVRALMRAQAEAGAGAVLVVTAEGRVHSASRGFGELWELDHDALVARPAAVVFGALAARTGDPAAFLERNVRLGETSGDPERAELTLTDGRTLEQASAPIRGEDGTPYGRVWAYRDLTQQRRLANAHAELLLEQAARESAHQRSARLRSLHEAALTMPR